jgi:hypothetical protein
MTKSMMTMMLNPSVPRPRLAPHAARALGAASRLLDRLAARLAEPAARPAMADHAPMLEFHAEAGAPEGALYFNGERVGTLPGVTRL